MDQPRHLFVYFRSFQTQILHKNCSLQQDSNSDQKASTQGGDLLTTVTAKWSYLQDFSSPIIYKKMALLGMVTFCKETVFQYSISDHFYRI